MKFYLFGRATIAGMLLLSLAGCRSAAPYITVDGAALGTTFHIKAQSDLPEQTIYAEVMKLDAELKRSMSIFDDRSLLSRINRGETDSLDRHLIYNILAADSVSRISNGRYDITVKPLVEAWGFAGKQGTGTPDLDSLLPLYLQREITLWQKQADRFGALIQLFVYAVIGLLVFSVYQLLLTPLEMLNQM